MAPVKGMRVLARDSIEIGPHGVRQNRRFFVVDESGAMVNGKRLGLLQAVVPDYSDAGRTLALRFPDGTVAGGPVAGGNPLAAGFFSATLAAVELDGPWSAALTAYLGTPVRLVEATGPLGAVDRGEDGALSLISSASVAALAGAAGVAGVDPRRLRMLIEIDGIGAHEEDRWVGRTVQIGSARIALRGHVGRCMVTKLDPDSGVRDLETLDALASYRSRAGTTEPLACGVVGRVLAPGTVRVGDPVRLG